MRRAIFRFPPLFAFARGEKYGSREKIRLACETNVTQCLWYKRQRISATRTPSDSTHNALTAALAFALEILCLLVGKSVHRQKEAVKRDVPTIVGVITKTENGPGAPRPGRYVLNSRKKLVQYGSRRIIIGVCLLDFSSKYGGCLHFPTDTVQFSAKALVAWLGYGYVVVRVN